MPAEDVFYEISIILIKQKGIEEFIRFRHVPFVKLQLKLIPVLKPIGLWLIQLSLISINAFTLDVHMLLRTDQILRVILPHSLDLYLQKHT